jgi:2-methylcitrate dehydratase PrpD
MTPTRQLLAFAAAPPVLPAAVAAAATALLDDTLLVGAAGAGATGADAVLTAATRWGDGGSVPLMGRAGTLPAASAAFVNGFQIHCLEWDAVHEPAVVHAMSVVTAAVHAACHARGGVSHADALTALVVGVEIACALGVAATSPLKFFRPATAGLLGASLACARISGVAPGRFDDVLGLAYSFAAGTMQAHVEGSIALPLQVANAARAAVTAADLVAAGLSGPHDPLEGPFGYFKLFDDGDLAPVAATLGEQWRLPEISFKPWPCGRASHATLGMLAGRTGADVLRIEARVPPLIKRLVGRPWADDMSPATARLCLPFLAALMLADGRIDPRRFTPAAFADPALRALGARLLLLDDGSPDPNALSPQSFRLSLADGSSIEETVTATPGTPANPRPDLLRSKRALALELMPAPTLFKPGLAGLTGTP